MSDYDINKQLDTLTAMSSNMVPYLYEEELFGHLGNNLPKLTVGGLLLRAHELKSLEDQLSAKQQQQLHDAMMNFQSERAEWMTHYQQKVLQEVESRLGSLRWFLDDCVREPSSCKGNWRNEAEKRTIIAQLVEEAKEFDFLTDEVKSEVAAVDSRIRQFFKEGEFVWDDKLKQAFAPQNYWWLYGYTENVQA